jgi:G:T-mismatch repair DNA endonuclease (very short patch repair protein)
LPAKQKNIIFVPKSNKATDVDKTLQKRNGTDPKNLKEQQFDVVPVWKCLLKTKC